MFFLLSCHTSSKEIVYLGNQIGDFTATEILNEEVNDIFSMRNGYASYLYSMLEQDALEFQSGKHILESISNASIIYIFLGNQEFLRGLNDSSVENQENIQIQSELFSYYYYLILEEIRLHYDGKIILLSPFVEKYGTKEEKNMWDKFFLPFYSALKEIGEYFDCPLIDLREVSLFMKENQTLDTKSLSFIKNRIQNGTE